MGQYPSGAAALKSGDESRSFSFRRIADLARRPDGRLPLDAVRVRSDVCTGTCGHADPGGRRDLHPTVRN